MSVHNNKKKENLCTLEMFVDLDLKDCTLKNELLQKINSDLQEVENGISPKYDKYFENKDKFSNLGKAHLEIMKADKTIKKFNNSVYTLIAANKFKKLLKTPNTNQESIA